MIVSRGQCVLNTDCTMTFSLDNPALNLLVLLNSAVCHPSVVAC